MRSVEAMVERVTDRRTAGGGEVDVGPLVFHGGCGWHQLRAARAEEERTWTVLAGSTERYSLARRRRRRREAQALE